ncbi:hypothetical protein D3C73_736500 [compost metagenome]
MNQQFPGNWMDRDAHSVLIPQNYVALNRGDMFIPIGAVPSPIVLASMSQMDGLAGQRVHAIPVSQADQSGVNAQIRPRAPIGMITPEYSGGAAK